MSEPLESERAGVTLESDALPQEDFPPGNLGRHPEAPGNLYLGQAAAVPTSGQPQAPSEDPINFEFEAGDGEAPQPPVPSDSQAAPTVTTDGAVGGPLQHKVMKVAVKLIIRAFEFLQSLSLQMLSEIDLQANCNEFS
jgi:hypothetical protein